MKSKKEKLGIALVGLGTYSTDELAPALQQTEKCYLAGIVSGDEKKRKEWKEKYSLKDQNIYDYETFDDIADNDDIDIVYVVLPNDMHADFVMRAAQAGKHVITEKPMDTSVEKCRLMIEACRENNVRLSVGYRLHFDPFNMEMMRFGQNETFGKIRSLTAKNGMDVGKSDQWRLKKGLAGGGPLMDLGIYCVQGVIYTIGQLPIAVTAEFHKKPDKKKFAEVEEGISWKMEFADGVVASCETSYTQEYNILRADAHEGWFELQPAFEYRGLKGESVEGTMKFPEINQQARQMDDFARCVQEGDTSRVPGEMGMRDVEILLAIYRAAETGERVELHLEKFTNLVEM
jgi:predicted dehydrogenase